MFRRLYLLQLAIVSLFSLCAIGVANGQTVRVEKADGSGAFGHGYVFGDRNTGQCMIAVPAHVIQSGESDLSATPVVGLDGKGGTALQFQQPDPSVDLAFGKIEGLGGRCSGRLPAYNVSPRIAAGTGARLTVTDTASGGTRTVPVRIRDKDLAGYFSIEAVPTTATPDPKILPGFSGSLIDSVGGGALGSSDLPLGLVINVCDGSDPLETDMNNVFEEQEAVLVCGDGEYARVLDFDLIRQLHERSAARLPSADKTTANWKLLDYRGRSTVGSAAALKTSDGCFEVHPQPGQSYVEINAAPLGDRAVTSVSINLCNPPDAPFTVGVGSGQTTYRTVEITQPATLVNVGRRPPNPVWIRLSPRDGQSSIAIAELMINQDN